MTPQPERTRTTADVIKEMAPHIGSVPHVLNDYVCGYCLGPVTGWAQCSGCHSIFNRGNAPSELREAVVPMSSVLNPSLWYTTLSTYKTFEPRKSEVLASVTYHFLTTHAARIREMLGGEPSVITIVPSKKGVPYEAQPLRKAIAILPPLKSKLKQTLVHRPEEAHARRTYTPSVFGPGPHDVAGDRVILIEDTWVSGATAVSAAGALLERGAASVALFPIARAVVDDGFYPSDHPYRVAMRAPYQAFDPASWPR